MVHRKSHKVSKKPSKRVVKLARKYKVKISVKRGSKRVYKTEKLILRQIRKKMRTTRTTRTTRKMRKVRASRFGNAAPFSGKVDNYGYNLPVNQVPGSRGQSSEWVPNAAANASRPPDMRMPSNEVPSFGTYKLFFDQKVPSVLPPNWNFMGQPGGQPPVAVGSPFYNYKTPGFGRRRRSRYGFGENAPPMAFPKMPMKLPKTVKSMVPKDPKITRNPNLPKITRNPNLPMVPKITRNPNLPRSVRTVKQTKFGRKQRNYGFGEIEWMMYPNADIYGTGGRSSSKPALTRSGRISSIPKIGNDWWGKLRGIPRKKKQENVSNVTIDDEDDYTPMPPMRGKKPYGY